MKQSLQVFVLSFLFLTTSCDVQTKEEASSNSIEVQAFRVVPQPFKNELVTTANLMANEQVELKAPVAGQVMEIFFKEGAVTNSGDLLVQLDDRNWKAQLIGVKAELDVAEKDLARKGALLKIGGSSQEEVDQSISRVETLKSQIQQLKVNIDLAKITAPFTGRLGMRDFSKGAFLSQGSTITTLSEVNKLKVDFTISQNHMSSIQVGKSVKVLIQTDTLEASIYAINPVIDPLTRSINVRAILQNPSKNVMPGTFAEVLVTTNYLNDALLIPSQAIVQSINEQIVFVSENGKVRRKVIKMGNRTADMVHVPAGISAGDTVLTTGLLAVKDGMDLIFQSVK